MYVKIKRPTNGYGDKGHLWVWSNCLILQRPHHTSPLTTSFHLADPYCNIHITFIAGIFVLTN